MSLYAFTIEERVGWRVADLILFAACSANAWWIGRDVVRWWRAPPRDAGIEANEDGTFGRTP